MPNANSPNKPGSGVKDRDTGRELNEQDELARIDEQVRKSLLPLPTTKVNYSSTGNNILRYPHKGDITKDSDYVIFEFYKYAPPFRKRSGDANYTSRNVNIGPKGASGVVKEGKRGAGVKGIKRANLLATAGNYFDYNQANDYEKIDDEYKSIIMYMPEDISTGFRSNWGGKAFSNVGAGILRSAGGEGLDKLDNLVTTGADAFQKLPAMAGSKTIRAAIQKITGDQLTNDDVFGSISGAILNPNTELLFDSVDMRNFQLNFKLVPRNADESIIINEICETFKKCTLPTRSPGKVFGASNQGITASFIGVPNLCRVSFMHGPEEHEVLPRYKMCAVTQVDVNYTPDGSYATYHDGQPVAIELALNFQETKICFAEEIGNGGVR